MNTATILGIVQIIVSVLLIVIIIVQNKSAGLGGAFGGDGGGNSFKSKQGMDKFLTTGTIVLVVLFIGLAIVGIFLG